MSSCSRANYEEEVREMRMIMVGGLAATQVNPSVDVGIDFFHNLSAEITYQDLISEIGESTGGRGYS